MRKIKPLDIFLLFLKILIPILILIPLVFFSYRLIEGRIFEIAEMENKEIRGGGAFLFAIVSHVLLFVINVVLFIVAGICYLISKKYKATPKHKKNVLTFGRLTLMPIVSQVLYFILILIVLHFGRS